MLHICQARERRPGSSTAAEKANDPETAGDAKAVSNATLVVRAATAGSWRRQPQLWARQQGLKRLRRETRRRPREARVLYENYRLEKMFHDNVPLSIF